MNVKVEGMAELNKILNHMPKKARSSAAKQLEQDMLDLQGKAQQLAPIDTGDLRGSAHSDAAETNTGVGGYVQFDEEYALKQHENMQYRHTKGGQAKYLEQPLKENIDKYIKNISEAIRKAISK